MKNILLCCLIVSIAQIAQSQNSWKVYHNGDLLLNTSQEIPKGNAINISWANLEKKGEFSFIYTTDSVSKEWDRQFELGDSIFTPVAKDNKFRITLTNRQLKQLLNGNDKAGLYTWPQPKDPMLAASIRIRKVQLCTLQLQ